MTYNRPDLAVKVNIESIKGYTMKDIGTLDSRITRLEYYTVLNALSLDSQTLSIKDSTGTYERFKNGIFADPFNDFALSRTTDQEFRISIDSKNSIARPAYSERYNGFRLTNTGTGYKVNGRLATIDFTNEQIVANPFATTYRNCTEGYWSFKGTLNLYPSYDNYTQAQSAAPQTVDINLADGFKALLADNKLKTQDISTVTANPVLTAKSGLTNYWSQDTTTTVTRSEEHTSELQSH